MAQIIEGSRLAGRLIIPDYDWVASALGDNGTYTVITFNRPDSTVYAVSTLSNPNSMGNYGTMTWQFYDPTGTTIIETHTWTITYDSSGNVEEAVMA